MGFILGDNQRLLFLSLLWLFLLLFRSGKFFSHTNILSKNSKKIKWHLFFVAAFGHYGVAGGGATFIKCFFEAVHIK